MPSKTSQIVDPTTTNIVYHLQVLENGEWYLYPLLQGQPDYSNAITKLKDIGNKTIRQHVKLEVDRHIANFKANAG